MESYSNNSPNDFLWSLLENPSNDARMYAYDLQRLVNDFPQSGVLQALLAQASEDKNLKRASVYFNPRALFKLINAPSTFTGVPDERIVVQQGIGGVNGTYRSYEAPAPSWQPQGYENGHSDAGLVVDKGAPEAEAPVEFTRHHTQDEPAPVDVHSFGISHTAEESAIDINTPEVEATVPHIQDEPVLDHADHAEHHYAGEELVPDKGAPEVEEPVAPIHTDMHEPAPEQTNYQTGYAAEEPAIEKSTPAEGEPQGFTPPDVIDELLRRHREAQYPESQAAEHHKQEIEEFTHEPLHQGPESPDETPPPVAEHYPDETSATIAHAHEAEHPLAEHATEEKHYATEPVGEPETHQDISVQMPAAEATATAGHETVADSDAAGNTDHKPTTHVHTEELPPIPVESAEEAPVHTRSAQEETIPPAHADGPPPIPVEAAEEPPVHQSSARDETVAEQPAVMEPEPVISLPVNETPDPQLELDDDPEETYDEIVGIDDIKIGKNSTGSYFSFDQEFGAHEDVRMTETLAPVAEATPSTGEHQDVSQYHDETMPYSFLWWLDKTRKEHAQAYQPYTKPAASANKKVKKPADALQQQYIENIFHITSVEGLDQPAAQPPVTPEVKMKEQTIIERFIREEPQIKPQSSDKLDNENKAKRSSEDRDELVSETLAAIYSDQMLYHKAISSYKKLMLKFPEKSRYFADKIEQLERKTN